jgi:hypothetical protein
VELLKQHRFGIYTENTLGYPVLVEPLHPALAPDPVPRGLHCAEVRLCARGDPGGEPVGRGRVERRRGTHGAG